ncbi:MAG TPA: type III pantothenate kinase, partial [Planctomycetia bacterium]|nr:type III pantothenate kinase [Planctomycetia bacterium]
SLLLASLHHGTAALPAVTLKSPPPALGKSTPEAIASGAYHAAIGVVERLVFEYRILEPSANVYLTGGDADLLAPGLAFPLEREPGLVLDGLRIALEATADAS